MQTNEKKGGIRRRQVGGRHGIRDRGENESGRKGMVKVGQMGGSEMLCHEGRHWARLYHCTDCKLGITASSGNVHSLPFLYPSVPLPHFFFHISLPLPFFFSLSPILLSPSRFNPLPHSPLPTLSTLPPSFLSPYPSRSLTYT